MTEYEREDAELNRLLRSLDHDPPDITAADVIAMARARRPRREWGQIAAVLTATLGLAGVAYALPGSPVRSWVDSVLDRPAAPEPADPGGQTMSRDPSAGAGIAFDPTRPLTVEFAPPLLGYLRVELADRGDLVAQIGSDEARFNSEPDRLVVEMVEPDTFELRIPRSANRVEVIVAGRLIFRTDAGATSAVARPGPDGRYLFPLEPTGR